RGQLPLPVSPPVTSIVLAAGAGSRLGNRPKALLMFGGTTALQRVVAASLAGGCDGVVVVLGAHMGAVRGGLPRDPRVRAVVNEQWESGQSSSLQTGWREVEESHDVLLFPVDYPLVDAEVVRQLIVARAGSDAERIVPVYTGQRGHPVVLRADVRERVLAVKSGESVRSVFGSTAEVVVANEAVLWDVDTWAEVERLQGLADLGPSTP
ncbi:MAG: nucleotidyltransferase family protein, partial [bacterium]